MKAPEFLEGCVIPGTQYEVVATLGSGTLGSVYEVVHRELGKRFALKAFDALWLDRGELVPRLRGQWRALAELEHPSLVAVTDAGSTEGGVPFLVMEWLEGETLATLLGRARTLSTAGALEVALGIVSGLEAAHGIGIVHGGIKPSNVFLAGANVKILDCGQGAIAAALREPVDAGPCRYRAPELAAGGPIDARADLFSLGVVLFEMLTGADPFRAAGDRTEVGASHLGRATRLTAVFADADPALEAVLDRLLERDPRCRPENAYAVSAALTRLAERYHAGTGFGAAAEISEGTEPDALRAEALPVIDAPGQPTRRRARFDRDAAPNDVAENLCAETIVQGPPTTVDPRFGAGEPLCAGSRALAPAPAAPAFDSTSATAKTSALPWSSCCPDVGAITTAHDRTAPLCSHDPEMSASTADPGPTRTAAPVRQQPGQRAPRGSGSEPSSGSGRVARTPATARWLVPLGVSAVVLVALAITWLSRAPARGTGPSPKSRQHVVAAQPTREAVPAAVGTARNAATAGALPNSSTSAANDARDASADRPAPIVPKRRASSSRTSPRAAPEWSKQPAEPSTGPSSPPSPTGHLPVALPGSGL